MHEQEFLKLAHSQIAENPLDRISASVLKTLQNRNFYFDTHIHIFDEKSVPAPVLYNQMIDFNIKENNLLKKALNALVNKNISRIIGLIKSRLPLNSRENTLNYYLNNIALKDKETICSTLMMDVEYGWMNVPLKTISEQIKEEKDLLAAGYKILPFIGIDPRRVDNIYDKLYDNFLDAFTGEHPFLGVKTYPSLGYLPSDKRLFPLYEICEQKNIPITTHTGRDMVAYAGECIDLNGIHLKNNVQVEYKKKICQNYFFKSKFLNHPNRWEAVLEQFPNLRINFAHFGGAIEWEDYGTKKTSRIDTILKFMDKYPNVYADYSFNMHSKKMAERLYKAAIQNPLIRERTLYGTDFFFSLPEAFFNLKKRQKVFIENIYELWPEFSIKNPLKFYHLENFDTIEQNIQIPKARKEDFQTCCS